MTPFRIGRKLLSALFGAMLLLLLVGPSLSYIAARALLPRSEACAASAGALLVLAGARAYPERAALAARLHAEGAAPILLLTNDGLRGSYSHRERRNPWMVERAARLLVAAGVPASAVRILPRVVASTHDEAELVRDHARAHDLGSILVVTSGYHVRRARWTFQRVLEGTGTTVEFCGTSPDDTRLDPAIWWTSPAGWDAVAGEYVRTVGYRILY